MGLNEASNFMLKGSLFFMVPSIFLGIILFFLIGDVQILIVLGIGLILSLLAFSTKPKENTEG